jgi:GxxExxY protein
MDERQGEKGAINFDPLSKRIIGAAMTVHRTLGAGFLESTYQRALAIELREAGIVFKREVELPVYYRDELIDTRRADFIVENTILELKAVEFLVNEHAAQLLMYLRATRLKIGLLLNFGAVKLQIRRIVN